MYAVTSAGSAVDLLLIEDDVGSAALIGELLAQAAPTQVTTAGDLRSAIDRLRAQAYDCVIIDLNLPDGRGAEVVDAVRAVNPGIPALILSGMDGRELAQIAVRTSAQGSLSKDGIDADLLWSAVATAMQRASDTVQRARMETLVRLASRTASAQDRIDHALAAGAAALDMPVGVVARIDGERLTVAASTGGPAAPTPGEAVDLRHTPCALTWQQDRPVIIGDLARPAYVGYPCCVAAGVQSYLGAPLVVAGRRVGTVSFCSPEPRALPVTRDDVAYLLHLTALIGGWMQTRESERRLRDADAAMNDATGAGRPDGGPRARAVRGHAVDRVRIESELRAAIRDGAAGSDRDQGLTVHYQPLVGRDGCVRGVETLVRWLHPTRGLLSPASFIPVAEEAGLMRPLGRWVLATALADWAAQPDLRISVNHGVDELGAPGFVEYVLDQLHHHGVEPDRLCIEVTETSILSAHGSTMDALARLRAHGVQLAIDDFGAGYTSLAHLSGSPFTMLKIDRSFIAEPDEGMWAIVEAMVKICDALGLESVVEGVEDERCLARLMAIRCATTQGYLHGRPAPRDVVLASIS